MIPSLRAASAPEVLAPAGDWECLRAAVENGADAVYFGLQGHNARARAANFQADELDAIFRLLHRRGVKGYVTVNTLVFTRELPAVEDLLRRIAAAGADAIIVQDLAVVRLARALCPDLAIHASTQMTLTSAESIHLLEELGVERVVLARELSLRDLRRIRRRTRMSLEVFVHGALCVAYSGQCLTSEALGGRSIDELLDEADGLPAPPTRAGGPLDSGAIARCRVVAVDRDVVLVEMGGKDQGYVPLVQFEKSPSPGDLIQLEIVRYDRAEDMWVLSREGAVERATWEDLKEGQIVEAFVEGLNKGGLEVKFNAIRAFMPLSQISLYRVEDASEMLRTKIRCQVVEVDRREKRVIVSARALLELEAAKKKEEILASLEEGQVRKGTVRQVMPYGAFVDLGGGLDGLVHVSQMTYGRVEDPTQLVQPGQPVDVMVLKIDRENNRISLGMKQTLPDPWDTVEANFPSGKLVTGKVVRLENFGAFVELTPGVEALLPISEMSWTQRLRHPSEVLHVGQMVEVAVLTTDLERRRISLSLKQVQANPWTGAAQKFPPNSEQTGTVNRIADFGAFVELEPGVDGLVHISEMSDEHVRRVEDLLQVGQQVRVIVKDIDEGNRRISLTMKGTSPKEGAAEPAAEAKPQKKRKKPLRGGLE